MFQVNITMNGSAKIMRVDLINEVICSRVALDTLASRLITLVVSPCCARCVANVAVAMPSMQ